MGLQEEPLRRAGRRGAWIRRIGARGSDALGLLGLDDPVDLLALEQGRVTRRTPLRCTRELAGAAGARFFLKRYEPGAGRVGRIHRRRAPADVEWANLVALAAAGVSVPEACCAVWSPAGDRGASALLLRAVPGGEPLDTRLSSRAAGADRWLLAELVPLVRALHRAGFEHRDLYACHLLARTRAGPELVLIDLARARHREPFPARWRVKDLAALDFSLAPLLRRASRLRLFLAYLGRERLDRASRRLARRILQKATRIAAHEPRYG